MDLVGRARAVEAAQQPALVVVLDQRLGLLVVDREARCWTVSGLSSSRWIERVPSLVADALVLGRVEVHVVDVARSAHSGGRRGARTTSSSGTSISSAAVSRRPSSLELLVERLGLRDRAREAVEHEAVRASSLLDLLGDHRDDQRRRGPARPRPCTPWPPCPSSVPSATCVAQHVAGGDVRQPEVLDAGARPGCPCRRREGPSRIEVRAQLHEAGERYFRKPS